MRPTKRAFHLPPLGDAQQDKILEELREKERQAEEAEAAAMDPQHQKVYEQAEVEAALAQAEQEAVKPSINDQQRELDKQQNNLMNQMLAMAHQDALSASQHLQDVNAAADAAEAQVNSTANVGKEEKEEEAPKPRTSSLSNDEVVSQVQEKMTSNSAPT